MVAVPHEVLGEDVGRLGRAARPGVQLTAEDVAVVLPGAAGRLQGPPRITFVDELPRNPTGKVLKRELPAPAPANG